jgi:hypothetical protein
LTDLIRETRLRERIEVRKLQLQVTTDMMISVTSALPARKIAAVLELEDSQTDSCEPPNFICANFQNNFNKVQK